jgi:hypothetical protein
MTDQEKEDAQVKSDWAKRINSNDQYIIAQRLDLYHKHYMEHHVKSFQPKSYTNILGSEVQRTRSHLFSIPGMKEFMTLTTPKLSSLVPMVRIFHEDGGVAKEVLFDDFQNPNSMTASDKTMTTNRSMRGAGAGIKSVSIDMDGQSVATSDRMFKVKIKIFLSSLDDLFEDRNGFKYVDLLKPISAPKGACAETPTPSTKVQQRVLRMEYGYHEPISPSLNFTTEEKDAVRRARRTLMLMSYKQDISFNENGSLNIEIEYHGITERKSLSIDVFDLGLSPGQRKKLKELNSQVLKENCAKPSANPNPKPKEEKDKKGKEKTTSEQAADVRTEGYASFIKEVVKGGKIYAVNYTAHRTEDQDDEDLVTLFSPYNNRGVASDLTTSMVKPEAIKGWYSEKKSERDSKDDKMLLQHFYLGDLVDPIFALAKKEPGMQNIEFSLGSFSYEFSGKTLEIPLASLPISQREFGNWFKENVLGQGERQTYSLFNFLTDVTRLALSTFSPTASSSATNAQKSSPVPSLRVQTFNTKAQIPKGTLQNVWGSINVARDASKGLVENYFIHAVNYMSEPGYAGNPQDDGNNSIYWLVAASEHGVTKRIKYSKSENAPLTAARMVSGGSTLNALYKANVEMVGNPIFKPGMIVYITSNAFSQRNADELGLGGYFQVLKVSNSIEGGKFSTELETLWVKPTKKKS